MSHTPNSENPAKANDESNMPISLNTASTPSIALRRTFWLLLLAFIAWDFYTSPTVDFRNDPPLIAAGSGKISAAAHCSMPE